MRCRCIALSCSTFYKWSHRDDTKIQDFSFCSLCASGRSGHARTVRDRQSIIFGRHDGAGLSSRFQPIARRVAIRFLIESKNQNAYNFDYYVPLSQSQDLEELRNFKITPEPAAVVRDKFGNSWALRKAL